MLSQRTLAMYIPPAVVVAATAGALLFMDPADAKDDAPKGASAAAHPAGYGTSIVTDGPTQVGPVAAADAVCSVRPDAVRALVRAKPDATVIENIRTGLPVIDTRMTQLQQAAVGRPALSPVLVTVKKIRTAWNEAIQAADGDEPAAAKQAISRAGKRLKQLDATVAQAYPDRQTDCS